MTQTMGLLGQNRQNRQKAKAISPADAVANVLAATNRERTGRGFRPLSPNPALMRAAQLYAERMARTGRFSHTSDDGSLPWDRARAAGYSYTRLGENIAYGQRTSNDVMRGWMNSPGHRDNLLHPDFTEIGVGYAQSPKGRPYWVQLFGRP